MQLRSLQQKGKSHRQLSLLDYTKTDFLFIKSSLFPLCQRGLLCLLKNIGTSENLHERLSS